MFVSAGPTCNFHITSEQLESSVTFRVTSPKNHTWFHLLGSVSQFALSPMGSGRPENFHTPVLPDDSRQRLKSLPFIFQPNFTGL